MRYLVKNTKAEAEEAEARCQAHMIATVPGYCAERWADLKEHSLEGEPTGKHGFYTDERVEQALTQSEKDSRVDKLEEEKDWKETDKLKAK